MKDLTGQQFTWLTVLMQAPERKSGRLAWRCQCKCGNIIDVITNSLTSGNTKSCGCFNSKGKIKDISNQQFGRLTALYPTEKRSGTNVIWHCKCDCGNECDISVAHLGKTVFSCGCYRADCAKQKGYDRITNLIGQRFGKLIVQSLVKDDERVGAHWFCHCDCGNTTVVQGGSLIQGQTNSCGCLKSSSGELLLKQLFDKLEINYESESTLKDCKSNRGHKLRFDFYLPEYNCYIEYDGIQHFKPTFGEESFLLQQENDNIKNNYCQDNNICLIRIPYQYKTYKQLESLLNKYLTNSLLTAK